MNHNESAAGFRCQVVEGLKQVATDHVSGLLLYRRAEPQRR
jgi:hypothetical protein